MSRMQYAGYDHKFRLEVLKSAIEAHRRMKGKEMQTFFSGKKITWKYIVERGAWWGGFWERLVRSTK